MTNLVSGNTTLINNLTHDGLTGFVADEHIDWTSASAGTIDASNYVNTGNTTYTAGNGLTLNTTEFEMSGSYTGEMNISDILLVGTLPFGSSLSGAGRIEAADADPTLRLNDTSTSPGVIHDIKPFMGKLCISTDVGNSQADSGINFKIDNAQQMLLTTSGLEVTGDITATGDVTAYSDERLKRNIETINKPIDIVNALRGVKFEKDGRHSTGVIAQEVEKVLPEVVHTDAEGMKSVAYGNVVGVLIEAIKEQQKQIDWLTAFWQSDAERDSFNKD